MNDKNLIETLKSYQGKFSNKRRNIIFDNFLTHMEKEESLSDVEDYTIEMVAKHIEIYSKDKTFMIKAVDAIKEHRELFGSTLIQAKWKYDDFMEHNREQVVKKAFEMLIKDISEFKII